MEAQATPGNPREERKDTLVTGKGVQWEKYIPGRGSRGLRQNRTSVAFIPEYPSSGEASLPSPTRTDPYPSSHSLDIDAAPHLFSRWAAPSSSAVWRLADARERGPG